MFTIDVDDVAGNNDNHGDYYYYCYIYVKALNWFESHGGLYVPRFGHKIEIAMFMQMNFIIKHVEHYSYYHIVWG